MGLEPGARFGKFRIRRELGRGGMAVVYEAVQTDLQRSVALKVVQELGGESLIGERFQREAEAGARLQHPNIVQVYETGRIDDKRYIAMELVAGRSLADVIHDYKARRDELLEASDSAKLDRRRAEQHAVTETTDRAYIEWAVKHAIQVLRGLAFAHDRGVLHRDVKPRNLLLSETGRIMIADFGLARVLDQPGLSRHGEVHGTPWYMSPEQVASGRIQVDHRTDVYSAGVVLYEMLALRRPFRGEQVTDVFDNILHREPPPLRSVNPRLPRDLETVVQHAMEKDPERRYPTATEFADDLQRFLDREDVRARPVGPLGRAGRLAMRHKALTSVSAALAIVLVSVAVRTAMASVRTSRRAAEMLTVASAHENAGAYALAEGVLRELLEHVRPGDPVALRRVARVRARREAEADRLVRLAERLVLERRFERAREVLRNALEMRPGDPRARRLQVEAAGRRPVVVRVLGGAHSYTVREYVQVRREFSAPIHEGTVGPDGTVELELRTGDYIVAAWDKTGRFGEAWIPVDPFLPVRELVLRPRSEAEVAGEMVPIGAGAYVMGANDPEDTASMPAHTALVPAFLIDRREISHGDFERYRLALAELGLPEPAPLPWPAWKDRVFDPAYAELAIVLDWSTANAYLAFHGKRLPTETEWEAAARGADGRLYGWGNDYDRVAAGPKELAPVRSAGGPGSGHVHGLFCMNGNLREWTADRYLPYPSFRQPTPDDVDASVQAIVIPNFTRRLRVTRGGFFDELPKRARSTHRFPLQPDARYHVGARGVRTSRSP